MATYEVLVQDIYKSQTEVYLKRVVAEICLSLNQDPFFDNLKLSLPNKYVLHKNNSFTFRFNLAHKGRPDIGRYFVLDSKHMELSYLVEPYSEMALANFSVNVNGDLNYDSLLTAIHEIAVQEIMGL